MNLTYLFFFTAVIIGTLMIAYWSAKTSKTAHQFFSAAAKLTGTQNGLALAGDYLSAASFLGIIGAIALHGYDGFYYSLGFLVSYLLLYAVGEPVRHLGQYTLADVFCARFPSSSVRIATAMNTLVICILYIVPQLVGAGLLVHWLLGWSYPVAVVVTGILMTVYILVGGMVSASWVQITKTVLLVSTTFLFALIILFRFHFDVYSLSSAITKNSSYGVHFFSPGHLFHGPLDTFSLNLTLMLGTAGLPHILIRFYTVRNAQGVRTTITTASSVLAVFYLLTPILGMGAVALIPSRILERVDPTGNLTIPLVAEVLGGPFWDAFVSAVAFITILAVVTGLLLCAASTFSHDLYLHVWRKGNTEGARLLPAARVGAVLFSVVAITLALSMQHLNATVLVSLTFVFAASTNLPVLLLTLFWRRFHKIGVLAGLTTGFVASIACLLMETHVLPVAPPFGLENPGVLVIPLGFLGAWVGSWIGARRTHQGESAWT